MLNHLKTAILLLLATQLPLKASINFNFYSISREWIATIFLFLLFFAIFLSIIRDLKAKKKELNDILIVEKEKNIDEKNYLTDISEKKLKSIKSLEKSIKELEEDMTTLDILEKVKKDHKIIFNTAYEENIFLHVTSNKEIGKLEIFEYENIFTELKKFGLLNNTTIKVKKAASAPLLTNKEILQSIVFLFSKLQLEEHGLRKANLLIDIDEINDKITISIPTNLKLPEITKEVIYNNIKPKYDFIKNKYYGLYLFLINNLANRLNGKLKVILESNKRYRAEAIIPVDFDKPLEVPAVKVDKKLISPKKALIISNNIDTINKIETYLNMYNFDIEVDIEGNLNKEIPNFLNYDLVLMDAEHFEPILSEYIASVKKYSDLKIISLEKNGKIYEYPNNLIDSKINKNFIDIEINSAITKLFKDDLTAKDKSTKNKKVSSEEKNKVPKVIIADDDKTNLHILEYLIKQYGFEVCTANDGEEALDILEKDKCDLIILDSIMPKMDGFETIKKIREKSKYNATPVVIHTSFSLHNNSIEDIFKLGFDSFLPKPFNERELKAMLERYLDMPNIETKQIKKEKENIKQSKPTKEELKEFLAIFGDSDKLIEKYIRENRNTQLSAILKDLKEFSIRIGANYFIDSINKLEEEISLSKEIDNGIIYTITNDFKELKNNIIKELNS